MDEEEEEDDEEEAEEEEKGRRDRNGSIVGSGGGALLTESRCLATRKRTRGSVAFARSRVRACVRACGRACVRARGRVGERALHRGAASATRMVKSHAVARVGEEEEGFVEEEAATAVPRRSLEFEARARGRTRGRAIVRASR